MERGEIMYDGNGWSIENEKGEIIYDGKGWSIEHGKGRDNM